MRWKKTLLLSLISSSLYFTSAHAFVLDKTFSAGEHVTLGDEVKLYFSASDNGGSGNTGRFLHLQNGIKITYGEIISLGDFYGTPSEPISSGKTEADQKTLFLKAFNAFATEPKASNEVHKILDITHEEQIAVKDAMARGEKIEDVYKRIGEDTNRRYNCVTGGGCSGKWWLNEGRYLQLAKTDYDHFRDRAVTTYDIGHELAIQQAINAHEKNDINLLETAYAMNAFACHFLSDRFSSGHMRTPRSELNEHTTPSVLGSLLSHYMHAEEGKHGLHVHNAIGVKWVAYGDMHYFDENSARHREMIAKAMQLSADEVFQAYLTGQFPQRNEISKLIPIPDTIDDQVGSDLVPMFYWDTKHQKLMRRANLANVHDLNFTSDWWGWSTFFELTQLYGYPNQLRSLISGYEKEAEYHGIV